jgi:cytochrome d ubiquinol oxidase subunit I
MDSSIFIWSRLQFAMTAAYHWLFVPLTLGLSMVMAIMETMYVIKKDEFWKKTAKFWMKVFAINFAVGIATGIILEFEFGTNWSNYSWFVGDLFGAPLAIEGIIAFFMEATFFAVMFFGWDKVSKKFHLASTWLTGIGATISAYWILVANGWMQNPVGTTFNPDTVRSEMASAGAFWEVISNPMAVEKFFHSVLNGWFVGGTFVLGMSCWFLLKKREIKFAKKSALIGAIIGAIGVFGGFISGDRSGVNAAELQPMKLAASEGLWDGGRKVPFSIVPGVEVPGVLSFLATHDFNGYVPGINDILAGYTNNKGEVIPSAEEKIQMGKTAIAALKGYRENRESDPAAAAEYRKVLEQNEKYLGYGYLDSPQELVPNVPLVYWSFRLMIGFGMVGILLFILAFIALYKDKLQDWKWLLWLGIITIPMAYLSGQFGWVVAEVGRQPWTIQGLLPVKAAISSLSAGAVKTTFFVFLGVFALFLVIEIRIMIQAFRKGPEIADVKEGPEIAEVKE